MQKSYADKYRTPRNFQIGEKVFLRVRPHKSSISFGRKYKLAPSFVGPFEVLEEINLVAYHLALALALSYIHDVFHVSLLKRYKLDPKHILNWNALQVKDRGTITIQPYQIIERKQYQLYSRMVDQCKVQWDQYSAENATWEDTAEMEKHYPNLF